jgi:uncharacterized protein (DUF1330 family)
VTTYVIFNYLQVFDEERIQAYRERAHPLVAKYGGRVVVRPGALSVVEGRPSEYLIVTQWDTVDAALDWYHSPEYQEARKIRDGAAEVQVLFADGAVSCSPL